MLQLRQQRLNEGVVKHNRDSGEHVSVDIIEETRDLYSRPERILVLIMQRLFYQIDQAFPQNLARDTRRAGRVVC
jgi:hypothetical protein